MRYSLLLIQGLTLTSWESEDWCSCRAYRKQHGNEIQPAFYAGPHLDELGVRGLVQLQGLEVHAAGGHEEPGGRQPVLMPGVGDGRQQRAQVPQLWLRPRLQADVREQGQQPQLEV